MKQEIKQRWINALESGEYKQGVGRLQTTEGAFCCLGVLCDLHSKETGFEWGTDDLSFPAYDRSSMFMPDLVTKWSGMKTNDGPSFSVDNIIRDLMRMNDNRVPFVEIAKTIKDKL